MIPHQQLHGSSHNEAKNVILLGSTGDGKSTLGNYINNCRRCDQPFIFEESPTPQPHTQEVKMAIIKEFNTQINLYDTPGMNEYDAEKDFLHMLNILSHVRHMQTVTCLLLVIRWDFKTDNQTILSLKYIKKLFKPVFDAGNVILVFTKVPSETYEELHYNGQWKEVLHEKINSCNEELETNIKNYEFLNACAPQEEIDAMWERVQRKCMTDKLIDVSFISRRNIFHHFEVMKPVSMLGHRFPLPPSMEQRKALKLLQVTHKIEELTISIENENCSRIKSASKMIKLAEDVQRMEQRVFEIEDQLNVWATPQRTLIKYLAGDDVIKLTSAGVLELHAPANHCTPKFTTWNCKVKVLKTERTEYDTVVTVEIQPSMLNLKKRNSCRWYCRAWVEFNGEEIYQKDFERLQQECTDLRGAISDKKEQFERVKSGMQRSDESIDKSKDLVDCLREEGELLSQDDFQNSELGKVIDLLTVQLRNSMGVAAR